MLSIQCTKHTFSTSLNCVSSSLESTSFYEDFPPFSYPQIQESLGVHSNSLLHCYDQSLISYLESHKESFLNHIYHLLQQRKWDESSLLGIFIHGSHTPISFLSFLSQLYPTLPIYLQTSEWSESCLQFGKQMILKQERKEKDFIGEEINGKRSGYGEELHYGVCVYRGFWKEGVYHGFGELFSDEGRLVYRGEFQKGVFEGKGIYFINDREYIKGEFTSGVICDGIHTSYYLMKDEITEVSRKTRELLSSQICYEGYYKRGMRNGIGKEYDEEGKLLYEGCFYDNVRYGDGILYMSNGRSLEGSFVDGILDGEVREYSSTHALLSVITYHRDSQLNQGQFFTEEGYLLYDGGVMNNQYYSHGILYYPGGHIRYDGEFLDGLFNGYGQLYNTEGDLVYIGEFRKGMREGHGKEYLVNMFLKYIGCFREDRYHGHGKLFFSEGHFYEGDFTEGVVTGVGRMVWSEGRCYQGDFVNGLKEGRGVYTWSNNQQYEGEWKKDKREGQGTQYDSNHSVLYEGEWKNDIPSGKGKIFYTNGSYYVGDVLNNQREGKGIQYNEENVVEYEGEWKNDRPHGYGVFHYLIHDNQYQYEGQWVNGEREGPGRILYSNGNCFIGHFKKGFRQGKGCLLNANGKIIKETVYETNSEI